MCRGRETAPVAGAVSVGRLAQELGPKVAGHLQVTFALTPSPLARRTPLARCISLAA